MVFLQRIENMFKSPFPSPLPISKNDCELEKKSNLNIVGYFVNKQKSKRRHRQKYGKFVIKHNFWAVAPIRFNFSEHVSFDFYLI